MNEATIAMLATAIAAILGRALQSMKQWQWMRRTLVDIQRLVKRLEHEAGIEVTGVYELPRLSKGKAGRNGGKPIPPRED